MQLARQILTRMQPSYSRYLGNHVDDEYDIDNDDIDDYDIDLGSNMNST